MSNEENIDYSEKNFKEIRENLKKIYEENKNLFHEKDYERLLNDDNWLIRFAKRRRGNIDASTQFILNTMIWRKENGVSALNEQCFPSEFFLYSGIYPCGEDLNGNLLIHLRIKLYYKPPVLYDLIKKYTVYRLQEMDEMAAKLNKRWSIIFDCTDTGISNSDIDFANLMISMLRNYFPYGQLNAYLHNIPWMLSGVINLAFKILPKHVKKLIKSTNKQTVSEYISPKNLPRYLDGQCEKSVYRHVPVNCKSLHEMFIDGQLNISANEYEQAKQYIEKIQNIIEKDNE